MRGILSRYTILFSVIALSCAIFAFSGQKTTAASALNRQVNYQGKLLTSSGVSVTDGSYSIQFSIYDAASGGNRLWTAAGTTSTPSAVSVTVSGGLFTVQLGDTDAGQNAFDFNWYQSGLYLGVTVAADSEMTPRKRLTAVPYAFVAETLQGQYASSSVTSDGGALFALQQHSSDAATADRTSLYISTSGTSNAFDYLIKGSNGSEVFTVSRQGHTTTTGNLGVSGNTILGDATSDTLTVNARLGSSLVPTTNGAYDLGSSLLSFNQVYSSSTVHAGGVTSTGNVNPFSNNTYDLGSFDLAWADIYASGTAYVQTDVVVGGLSVCLSDGTNCTAGGDSSLWTYNETIDFVRPNTNTTGLLVGGSTPGSAPLYFDVTTTSSRLYVGGFGSSTDVVIGNSTSSGLNSLFQLSGNDLYVEGNIGSASSVYSNGAFIAGTGSTYFGDGYINKTDGGFTVQLGGTTKLSVNADSVSTTVDLIPATNSALSLGSNTLRWLRLHSTDVLLNGAVVAGGSTSIVGASTTRVVTSGFSAPVDQAFAAREFILSGSTYGADSQTLSLIESTTGTLKITDGSTGGGWGGIEFATGTVMDVLTVQKDLLPGTNNFSNIGSATLSFADVYASGTAYVQTDVVVGGLSVCLSDGTNCTASGGGASLWTYDETTDYVRPNTNTTGLLVGGSTPGSAPLYFDVTTTSSRFYIGGFGSSTDVLIGNSTSSGLNSLFQLSGDDLYVEGNIGSATSVYTNGAFVAGTGSTYFGDGYINKTDGGFSLNLGGTAILSLNTSGVTSTVDLLPSSNNSLDLGSMALSWGDIYASSTAYLANVTSTNVNFAYGTSSRFRAGTIAVDTLDNASNVITINDSIRAASAFVLQSGNNNGGGFIGSVQGSGGGNKSTVFFSAVDDDTFIFAEHALALSGKNFDHSAATNPTVCIHSATDPDSDNTQYGCFSHDTSDFLLNVGTGDFIVTTTDSGFGGIQFATGTANGLFTVQKDLLPGTNNFSNIGSATLSFADVYASGTAYVQTDVVVGGLSVCLSDGTNCSAGASAASYLTYDATNDYLYPNTNTTAFAVGTSTAPEALTVVGNIQNIAATGTVYEVVGTSTDVGTGPLAMEIHGRLAYVADDGTTDQMHILDVSDPSSPIELSAIAASTSPSDITVAANYAYIISSVGLNIYDVSNPSAPAEIAFLSITGTGGVSGMTLYLQGTYLYVYDGGVQEALVIVDVSDPFNPKQVSSTTIGNNGRGVVVQGDYAYLISNTQVSSHDFFVYDVSNPASPTQVGSATTSIGTSGAQPRDIKIQGRHAYITNLNSFSIVDVGDPATPVAVDEIAFTGNVMGELWVQGRYAYALLTTTQEIAIIDITSSTNAFVVDRIDTGALGITTANEPTVNGRNLYLADSSGNKLNIIDLMGIETTSIFAGSGEFGYLQVWNNLHVDRKLFVEDTIHVGLGGIISDGPVSVSGTRYTGAGIFADGSFTVSSTGDLILNTTSSNSVNVLIGTSTGSEKLTVLGGVSNLLADHMVFDQYTTSVGTGVVSLAVQDRYLYVTDDGATDGLHIFDVDDPFNPSELSFITASTTPTEVAVRGNYAFVIGSSGLNIYDVTDRYSPREIAFVAISSSGNSEGPSLDVQGNYVYAYDGSTAETLTVVDVTDPYTPVIVNTQSIGNDGRDIVAKGNLLYLASELQTTNDNFWIFDISDPTSPTQVGSTDTDETGTANAQPRGAFVQGGYAYVANQADTFTIIDVTNPSLPFVTDEISLNGNPDPIGVWVQGRYAYVASASSNAIEVIDVSSSTNAIHVTTIRVSGNPNVNDVVGMGRYLFTANITGNSISVVKIPAIETSNIYAGAAELGTLSVRNYAHFDDRVSIMGELHLAQGLYSDGVITVGTDTGTSTFNGAVSTTHLVVTDTARARDFRAEDNETSTNRTGAVMGFKQWKTATDIAGVWGHVTGTTVDVESPPSFNSTITVGTQQAVANAISAGGYFSTGIVETLVTTGFHAGVIAQDLGSSVSSTALLAHKVCNIATGGDIALFSSSADPRRTSIRCDGGIYTDTGTVGSPADYAEFFYTTDTALTTGEIITFAGMSTSTVKRSTANDRAHTLGVVSANPLVLGNAGPDAIREHDPNYVIVGLLGQLPVKASNANGDIQPGDLLMAGDGGVAVKASGVGVVIGEAMEALVSPTGMIEAYVSPRWSGAPVFEDDGSGATIVLPQGTASTSTTSYDSHELTFRGSAWSTTTSQVVTSSFTLINDVRNASSSNFAIRGTSGGDLLTISDAGNVGVSGDLSVGARLYLGSRATGQASTSTYIFVDDTSSTSSQYIATNADGWSTNETYDYAERFFSEDDLQPGDLVVADPNGVDRVKRSATKNDTILGIVSTRPGFITGARTTGTHPIALAGRVPTRVSTTNGPIQAGDELAPSDVPGVAVKALGAGPTVGIALESYDAPMEGRISAFVQPGWRGGEVVDQGPSSVTYVEYTDPGISPRAGLATIAMGAKEVNVSFPTLNAYPLVTITPYGLPVGGWGLANVNDHGFTVVLESEQSFDLVLAWKAEPSQDGGEMWYSDGTFAPYDPTSGLPVLQEIEEAPVTEETASASSSTPDTTQDVTTSSTTSAPPPEETSTSSTPSSPSEEPAAPPPEEVSSTTTTQ